MGILGNPNTIPRSIIDPRTSFVVPGLLAPLRWRSGLTERPPAPAVELTRGSVAGGSWPYSEASGAEAERGLLGTAKEVLGTAEVLGNYEGNTKNY